ncbi:hypothetical protein KY290_010362 [Solanum tuberosum]|uniref:Uncharacterized protein n=1 Tax=Solanum tuberosum TaxID=4113 RepID=A0ABQ7VY75_SOLTU|nr:hypothetical protein KY284_010276 [Solanum tuberosum]KAH0773225.1 hypothetical protein KY290_010362 [Solanum tuberosum]
MFRPSIPIPQKIHFASLARPSLLRPTMNLNMNMNNPPPHQILQHPLLFATQPTHPLHLPQSWVEMSLQGHATIFSMEINRVETLVILQNQNFLAQLISEGMKIAMKFFCKPNVGGKCSGPLAPPVILSFIQTMQTLWNFPKSNRVEYSWC